MIRNLAIEFAQQINVGLAAQGSPGLAAAKAIVGAFVIGGLVGLAVFAMRAMSSTAARKSKTVLQCQCGYDLRGTIKAKADTCPECGREIVE